MDFLYKRLDTLEALSCESMTFPYFRSLLHDATNEDRLVGALIYEEKIISLILYKKHEDNKWEILSIFTKKAYRNKGVAKALLTKSLKDVKTLGALHVSISYLQNKESNIALAKVLDNASFNEPIQEYLMLRTTWQSMLETFWFKRFQNTRDDFSIKAWSLLSDKERVEIKISQNEQSWIPTDLVPFTYENGYAKEFSFALIYKDKVVGWSICHLIAPDTLRFTCTFVKKELQKYAQLLTLFTCTMQKMKENDISYASWSIPPRHEGMFRFGKKHMAPYSIWSDFMIRRKLLISQ